MTDNISVTVLSNNEIVPVIISDYISATVSKVVVVNQGGSNGIQPYYQSFIQSHLTANKIVIPHNRNAENGVVSLSLFNNLNLRVYPTDFEVIDVNNCRIDLTGYTPITGTWRVKVL